jgi:hypothetical protein
VYVECVTYMHGGTYDMFLYVFMYVYTCMSVCKCLLYGHMYMYHISTLKFPLVANSFC